MTEKYSRKTEQEYRELEDWWGEFLKKLKRWQKEDKEKHETGEGVSEDSSKTEDD